MAPRGLRLLGHPAHPALVHLPLGLLSASLVWDVVALASGDPFWWRMAFWSIAAGLAAAVPAACAGLLDWAGLEEGAAARTADWHLWTIATALAAYAGSLIARKGPPLEGGRLAAAIALSWGGVALLAWGGWLGGKLVYGHGVNVDRR